MFDFRHHVVAAGKLLEPPASHRQPGGPICTDDNVALDVALPELERGDIVADSRPGRLLRVGDERLLRRAHPRRGAGL